MSDHDPLCPWLEALKLPERFPDLGGRVGIPDADQCDYEPLIAKVRADERWKISDALATQEALAADRLTAGWTSYDDGQRDAFDLAEQIARDPALRAGSDG